MWQLQTPIHHMTVRLLIFIHKVVLHLGHIKAYADACASGKSKVINKALQDMGMGRYQWQLFALCGGGW